ncbi:UNVERIFIED_CONTAM: SAG-related sequence protein, putative [Hammondia hammondi]|eukprot:XP_008887538.1 SAG-related sequence protein, putative [Hammondia hammondi]
MNATETDAGFAALAQLARSPLAMLSLPLKIKLSLLTLGAFAVSTSALQAKSDSAAGQQPDVTIRTCQKGQALRFNVTEAGQSILFKCDQTLQFLDPALVADSPTMYKGSATVQIHEFLPGATLTEVTTAAPTQTENRTGTIKEKEFNFTVPILPGEENEFHVYCRAAKAASRSEVDMSKDCQVNFHIASLADRPVMAAASAIAGMVASLLQFA